MRRRAQRHAPCATSGSARRRASASGAGSVPNGAALQLETKRTFPWLTRGPENPRNPLAPTLSGVSTGVREPLEVIAKWDCGGWGPEFSLAVENHSARESDAHS